jgi:outer membrane lipoprotein
VNPPTPDSACCRDDLPGIRRVEVYLWTLEKIEEKEEKWIGARKGNKLMKAVRYCTLFACISMAGSLLCAGCAPVISQGALKEVDQTLSFEQVLENPESYKGRIVLLGGDIIETQNFSDRTLLSVLQRPLGFNKKPKAEDVSRGRFIVYTLGFLDPAIYRRGRKITVVGSVMGRELRPLGEIEYSYPVIEKKELYLWPADEYLVTEPRVHFGVGIGIWR